MDKMEKIQTITRETKVTSIMNQQENQGSIFFYEN